MLKDFLFVEKRKSKNYEKIWQEIFSKVTFYFFFFFLFLL